MSRRGEIGNKKILNHIHTTGFFCIFSRYANASAALLLQPTLTQSSSAKSPLMGRNALKQQQQQQQQQQPHPDFVYPMPTTPQVN